MKRRYKILLIIISGIIITIIINSVTLKNKLTLVSMGDGVSLGMTPYKVAGSSFNDYLKAILEENHKLDEYNNEFSQSHLKIHELNEIIEDNVLGKFTRIPIKQTIAKAEILTICIGMDELADDSLEDNMTIEIIENYLNEYQKLLKTIRTFYDKKIIIIGLYPTYNLEKKDIVEINNSLKKIAGKYNCQFLDILPFYLNAEYFLEKTSYYMNYKAHKKIAVMLKEMII